MPVFLSAAKHTYDAGLLTEDRGPMTPHSTDLFAFAWWAALVLSPSAERNSLIHGVSVFCGPAPKNKTTKDRRFHFATGEKSSFGYHCVTRVSARGLQPPQWFYFPQRFHPPLLCHDDYPSGAVASQRAGGGRVPPPPAHLDLRSKGRVISSPPPQGRRVPPDCMV
jgi:hypothetical protein